MTALPDFDSYNDQVLCSPLEIAIFTDAEIKVVKVAATNWNSFAVSDTGNVYGWGSAIDGMLGLPLRDLKSIEKFYSNTQVGQRQAPQPYLEIPTVVPGMSDIVSLACSPSHCIAINKRGQCFSWGSALAGQLGHGLAADWLSSLCTIPHRGKVEAFKDVVDGGYATTQQNTTLYLTDFSSATLSPLFQPTPKLIADLQEQKIVAAACGDTFSVLLSQNGACWSFGSALHGELGLTQELVINEVVESDISSLFNSSTKTTTTNASLHKSSQEIRSLSSSPRSPHESSPRAFLRHNSSSVPAAVPERTRSDPVLASSAQQQQQQNEEKGIQEEEEISEPEMSVVMCDNEDDQMNVVEDDCKCSHDSQNDSRLQDASSSPRKELPLLRSIKPEKEAIAPDYCVSRPSFIKVQMFSSSVSSSSFCVSFVSCLFVSVVRILASSSLLGFMIP